MRAQRFFGGVVGTARRQATGLALPERDALLTRQDRQPHVIAAASRPQGQILGPRNGRAPDHGDRP